MFESFAKSLDRHGLFGAGSFLATITLSEFNSIIATVVGVLTGGYMLFRFLREYRKWKSNE